MSAGADDYLVKGEFDLRTLERSIRYAIERRRNEEALRRSQEELTVERDFVASVLDTVANMVIVFDATGRVVRFNRACEELTGYRPFEIADSPYGEILLVPEERNRVTAALRGLVTGTPAIPDEHLWVTKQGNTRLISWLNATLTDSEGGVQYIIGTGIDITEHRAAEQALHEAHNRLEQRVAERTAELQQAMAQLQLAHLQQKQFVADASHDLRTPMTIIRADLELLLERAGQDDRARKSLTRALEGIDRLDHLSNDLLTLTRLDGEAGTTSTSLRLLRLDELLLASISNLSLVSREKEISWNIDIDETIEIQDDELSLERAITNVLENGVKYSHKGAVVSVSLKAVGDNACITVSDRGRGISAEDLPRVFDRFYRGDRTRGTRGTGLGLSIVKSVVEAHDGIVTMHSQPGIGTTVTISLPLKAVAANREGLAIRDR
jgi:PAS domain S-box-containing protein